MPLQQQSVTQIILQVGEGILRFLAGVARTQLLQQGVGLHATANTFFIFWNNPIKPHYLFVDGAGGNNAERPGNFYLEVVFLFLLIREGKQGKARGRFLCFPLRFHRCQFYLLHIAHGVAAFVTENND